MLARVALRVLNHRGGLGFDRIAAASAPRAASAIFEQVALFGNFGKLADDEGVEDAEDEDGPHAEQYLAQDEVDLEQIRLRHQEVLVRPPLTGHNGGRHNPSRRRCRRAVAELVLAGVVAAVAVQLVIQVQDGLQREGRDGSHRSHCRRPVREYAVVGIYAILKTQRHVEHNTPEKGRRDGNPRVFMRVHPLKMGGPIDGDVAIDRHADDDVDRARHEGVDERQLQVGLVEGGGVGPSPGQAATRDIKQSRHRRQQDAKVGHGQAQQVDVHHPLEVGAGEHDQVEEVADNAHADDDVGDDGVGDEFDLKDGGLGGVRLLLFLFHLGCLLQGPLGFVVQADLKQILSHEWKLGSLIHQTYTKWLRNNGSDKHTKH